MRVLLIKISSMGDIIHTLPAVTDAAKAMPGIIFDWVVDPSFSEIPSWHPAVKQVIKFPLREWRGNLMQAWDSGEISKFFSGIRNNYYDCVIDCQGLLKSAVISRLTRTKARCGFTRSLAREPLASFFYNQRIKVDKDQHALFKLRELFAKSLGYAVPDHQPDYGVIQKNFKHNKDQQPYLVFLHGTTWESKQWPFSYWRELAETAGQAGFEVQVTWATSCQKKFAMQLSTEVSNVKMLPHLTISAAAQVLQFATAVVTVDTGFGHLSAAIGTPVVSIYGSTDPKKTGVIGDRQILLQADYKCSPCLQRVCKYKDLKRISPPCFETVPPEAVWEALLELK
jgi:heptosyltransferase I